MCNGVTYKIVYYSVWLIMGLLSVGIWLNLNIHQIVANYICKCIMYIIIDTIGVNVTLLYFFYYQVSDQMNTRTQLIMTF